MVRIEHGLSGQRLIVYPFYAIEQALNNLLIADLVVHSMGYSPEMESHYTDRVSSRGEYLLIYCTKGEGWYVSGGRRYVVPESHLSILPAEKPHQYGSNEHDPWCIYWAYSKEKRAKYIGDQPQRIISIDMDDNSRVDGHIAFFDELLSVLKSGTDEATINHASLSFNHLIVSFFYVKTRKEAKFSKSKAGNTPLINLAAHFVTENLENELTLKELTFHFGYSESYMYRLFFKETGYTPMNYFLHVEIDRACQLLLYTNTKINQTTLKLGLDGPYYFSRISKKIVNTSPKDYRHSLSE